MDQFIEKIKGLDRRVLISIGVAIAVLLIIIIVLIVSISSINNDDNKQDSTELNSQVAGTEVQGESLGETEIIGTEMETETEMGTEVGSESQSSENEVINGQLPSGTTNPDGEEILGSGNVTTPYMEILGEDRVIKTVEVGAGQSVYYDIYRVGGMYLTINDSDAYVVYNNRRYDAKNGKVSLKVGNVLASQAVRFEIGNKGSSAKSFEIKFSFPEGTRDNPTNINTLNTTNVSLSAENEIGYFYKYKAEKNGTIRFYVSGTNKCGMSVMNNRNSATRTFGSDLKVDEQGKEYIELDVNAGDVIMIQVYAYPDASWNYPATDVTWSGVYQ